MMQTPRPVCSLRGQAFRPLDVEGELREPHRSCRGGSRHRGDRFPGWTSHGLDEGAPRKAGWVPYPLPHETFCVAIR
jgi:hypothetical protein